MQLNPARTVAISALCGVIAGFLSVSGAPQRQDLLNWLPHFSFLGNVPWDYEILGAVAGLVTILIVGAYSRRSLAVTTYAFGFANGFSATVIFLHPEANLVFPTFLGWNAFMAAALLFLHFLPRILSLKTLNRDE